MQQMDLTRRAVLALIGAGVGGAALPARAADEPIILEWSDLVPEADGQTMQQLRQLGVVQHGQMSTGFTQQTQIELTNDYNGKLVRLPGYIVPLDFDGTGVSTFILVPYVGACIHVPPPPPNQLVFVTSETPYAARGVFEPVIVTGIFDATATATQLAEVGYSIVANEVVPFG